VKISGESAGPCGEDLVSVGRIGKASGTGGELRFYPYLEPDEVAGIPRFFVNRREFGLVELRAERIRKGVRGTLVIKFAGIETREQAREITGLDLLARTDDLPRIREGEFYAFELVGMSVIGPGGEFLGIVEGLTQTPLYFILEAGGLSVPLTREFVGEIDREKRVVRLKRL